MAMIGIFRTEKLANATNQDVLLLIIPLQESQLLNTYQHTSTLVIYTKPCHPNTSLTLSYHFLPHILRILSVCIMYFYFKSHTYVYIFNGLYYNDFFPSPLILSIPSFYLHPSHNHHTVIHTPIPD